MNQDQLDIRGHVTVRPVSGTPTLSARTKKLLAERGQTPLLESSKSNLVVNGGRGIVARLIGGASSLKIDRVVLGDLGDELKANEYPKLSDTGLIGPLEDLSGTPGGVFVLDDDNDKIYPDAARRYPTDTSLDWANTGTLSISGGESIFTSDPFSGGVDFATLGIERGDHLVLNTDSINPLHLGVVEIQSATELLVHNPSEYTTPVGESLQYRLESSGATLIINKLIRGNDFPEDEWGPYTLVKEAGLLFSDGTLFARTIAAPTTEDNGILLQPDTIDGSETSYIVEWVISL